MILTIGILILLVQSITISIIDADIITAPSALIKVNVNDTNVHKQASFAASTYCKQNNINYKLNKIYGASIQLTNSSIVYYTRVRLRVSNCTGPESVCPLMYCLYQTEFIPIRNKRIYLNGGCKQTYIQ